MPVPYKEPQAEQQNLFTLQPAPGVGGEGTQLSLSQTHSEASPSCHWKRKEGVLPHWLCVRVTKPDDHTQLGSLRAALHTKDPAVGPQGQPPSNPQKGPLELAPKAGRPLSSLSLAGQPNPGATPLNPTSHPAPTPAKQHPEVHTDSLCAPPEHL